MRRNRKKMNEAQDNILDKTIKVYDLNAFIDKEVNDGSNDTEYQPFHYDGGAAIIVTPDGEGCIVDYEAIGSSFNATSDTVSIDLCPKSRDDGKGHRTFSIVPTARLKVTVDELLSAPSRDMKVKDFFYKYDYNDRCRRNFDGIRHYLENASMVESKKSDDKAKFVIEKIENSDKKKSRKHLIIEDVDTAMKDINANMEQPTTIEKHVELPPVYADAVEQHEETKQHIGKVMKQLQDDANKIIAKNPGTGKRISRKPYTEKLSLDESLFVESYDELPDKDDEIIYTQKDLYLSDEEFEDDFVVEEEIGDKLSDDYGFLHNGFSWKRDGNKIIVSDIDWEIDECLTEKRNNCSGEQCDHDKEKRAQRREQDAKHRDKRKWYDDDDLDESVKDVAEEKVCDKCGEQPCVCECKESKLEEARQPDIFECPICHRNFTLGECEHDDSMCQCPRCHSQLIKTDNGEYTEYVESVQTDENKQSIEEDFNLTISLYEFEPWTDEAKKTWNKLNAEEGALERLEWELELEYPEGMSEGGFNDLLRFESDWVLQAAGIEEKPEEDEDDDDIYENLNTITESTDNVEWKNVCKAYCKKIGAELLFVNDYDFGYEDKNGNLVHKYADELENELKGQ